MHVDKHNCKFVNLNSSHWYITKQNGILVTLVSLSCCSRKEQQMVLALKSIEEQKPILNLSYHVSEE